MAKSAITELIQAAENRNGYTLKIPDLEFLQDSILSFVEKAIEKFIVGAREHEEDGEDFVHNVDHMTCIQEEVIDQWMYVNGKLKQEKYGRK